MTEDPIETPRLAVPAYAGNPANNATMILIAVVLADATTMYVTDTDLA